MYHYGSFSRKIISWNISSRPNADLVIQTFQKAYHTRNCPAGLMFHSDRGSQYITFAFRKLLDELNVVQSFSKKAYPFDNACCESFFKYLKKEETNRRNFRTYRDLYHSVFQYIKDFYNSRRPHGSLGYLIPDEWKQHSGNDKESRHSQKIYLKIASFSLTIVQNPIYIYQMFHSPFQ